MNIAVVGAGPAGCAAALTLAQGGARVTLVSDGRLGVGEHLPGGCTPLLEQLGITLTGIQCTGISAGDWQWEGISHPLGGGWLLDRACLSYLLRQKIRENSIQLIEPARLIGLEPGWRLQLDRGAIPCDFVVDASGRRAVVARRLGIARHRYTRQRARVSWWSGPAQDPDARLRIEEAASGWGYTCRIGPGRRVLAQLSEGQWPALPSLQSHLEGYVQSVPPRILPADATILEEVSGPGWLALGDAATTHDPRAGQGIWSALRAGLRAGQLVDARPEVLRAYREEIRERFHGLLGLR